MKKLLLGVLAFAGGIIAEKKFNISDRLIGGRSKSETIEDEEELEEMDEED